MPPRALEPAVARLATDCGRWWWRQPAMRGCGSCRRLTQSPARVQAKQSPSSRTDLDRRLRILQTTIVAPRRHDRGFEGGFTPQPLPRPVGMPLPPRPGENTGLDGRPLRQRIADWFDYDARLRRRREIVKEMKKPYFGDMSNLKYEKGKTFTAPPRLFKAEAALFFPNLQGVPLLESHWARCDTTPLLTGKISVVVFQSCLWAERQVATFISREANPALHEVLYRNDDVAQVVHINYEVNFIKAIITRLFRRSLRKSFPRKDWDKFIFVRGGVTDEMRECVGLINSKVGYTFLVDQHCRIRWAGSARSHAEERDSLARGVARLVEQVRGGASPATARQKAA